VLFRDALAGVVERALKSDEVREGKCPVIWFVDRRERTFKKIGQTYWGPVIDLAGGIRVITLQWRHVRGSIVSPGHG
jgi:hypothetical protein